MSQAGWSWGFLVLLCIESDYIAEQQCCFAPSWALVHPHERVAALSCLAVSYKLLTLQKLPTPRNEKLILMTSAMA
jgi:hypothetical protein